MSFLVTTLQRLSDDHHPKSREQVIKKYMDRFIAQVKYCATTTGRYNDNLVLLFGHDDYFDKLELFLEDLIRAEGLRIIHTCVESNYIEWAVSWAKSDPQ